MALVDCPECGKKISDQAKICPQCGIPFPDPEQQEPTQNSDSITGEVLRFRECKRCGERLDPLEYKCSKCGKSALKRFFMPDINIVYVPMPAAECEGCGAEMPGDIFECPECKKKRYLVFGWGEYYETLKKIFIPFIILFPVSVLLVINFEPERGFAFYFSAIVTFIAFLLYVIPFLFLLVGRGYGSIRHFLRIRIR